MYSNAVLSFVFNRNNLTFLLNISRDVPEDLGVALFGYVLPFLLLLTLVTNLLIVIVLWQPHMRTPTNLVLLAMAIADLLTLLSPSPWYFYLYTLGYHRNVIYPPRTCYIFHVMYEVMPALFHTYSIWLTLLLAAQRYNNLAFQVLSLSFSHLTLPLAVTFTCVTSLWHVRGVPYLASSGPFFSFSWQPFSISRRDSLIVSSRQFAFCRTIKSLKDAST